MEEAIDVKALRERFNRPSSDDNHSPKFSSVSRATKPRTDNSSAQKQSLKIPSPQPALGLQKMPMGDPFRRASSPLPPPSSGRNQPAEISKVRQAGEMLQSVISKKQRPLGAKAELALGLIPSPIGTPPPLRPALRPASSSQVMPLRRPLPAEGPRPLKPKRPPKVNLEPFLRVKQAPTLSAARTREGRGFHDPAHGSAPSDAASPPRPPQFKKPQHLTQQITLEEDEDEQETYDDIDVAEASGNVTSHGDEENDDIYEFIDQEDEEVSSDGTERREHKEPETLQERERTMEMNRKHDELRKRFQLQGNIEVLHNATVRHDWHGTGKLDLIVRQGENLEIVRVKDNPEGKWLARTSRGNYGYIINTCVNIDYQAIKRDLHQFRRMDTLKLPPPPPDPPQLSNTESNDFQNDEDDYDDVQAVANEFPPPPPEVSIDPKAEKEFRKKFKFGGPVRVLQTMMVDPSGVIKKAGGKDLQVTKGEVVDVIQLTNDRKALCRNNHGKYGYVYRSLLVPMEEDLYDDIDYPSDVADNDAPHMKPISPTKPNKSGQTIKYK